MTYRNKIKNLIASGFFLSIAFATKTVAVFDFFAFFLFLFLIQKEDKKLFIKKTLLYFFLPFTSAVVLFSLYFLLTGAFGDFVNSVFLQNVSYVGEQNKLLFPMGMLVLKTMILVSLVGFIYLYREKIPRATLFIYIWVIFSTYNAFFSDRPYTHYLIVLLPAFSLIVGHFYEYLKTRLIDLVLLILIGYLAIIHFEIYQKNISYYTNFIDVLMNKKSIIAYQSFFDKNTPLQYDIANFIKANVRKDEQVFLWSDNAQIYALSNKLPVGKYIVAYHITFYKNAEAITKMQIDTSRPKYIIQTIDIPLRQDILTSYRLRYIMTGAKIYERKI